MTALGLEAFVKIKKEDADSVVGGIQGFTSNFAEVEWMSTNGAFKYYWATIEDADMAKFKAFCQKIAAKADVEQIRATYTSKKSPFVKLQEKGFTKYEEAEFADFRVSEKNALVSVFENGEYQITVQKIHTEKEISVPYFFSLINRVLEIVGEKAGNK